MNRYIMIHHLRWPVIILLAGVLALLDQLDIINNFWNWFWPLLLISLGVLMLAERAALAAMDDEGSVWPFGGTPRPAPPQPGTSIVPAGSSFGQQGNGENQ
jgi:hypothetical protein